MKTYKKLILKIVFGIIILNTLMLISGFESENCSSGDLNTDCFLNYTYYVLNGETITANNLTIGTNGSLVNNSGITFTINLTGNFSIQKDGGLSFYGAPGNVSPAISPKAGSTLHIIADNIYFNFGSLISSVGGNYSVLDAWTLGGTGGTINISATNLYSYGTIIFDGGEGTHGGNAGEMYIQTTNLTHITGKIYGIGGAGAHWCQLWGGRQGSGGYLNITTNSSIINGTIDLTRGIMGYCRTGLDGWMIINHTGILNLTSANITRPPVIYPFCDSGDELTTCNITWNRSVFNNEFLNLNNLIIENAGGLDGRREVGLNLSIITAFNYTLNLTGNLTVQSGGNLMFDGVSGTGYTFTRAGAILHIIADNIYFNSGSLISSSGGSYLPIQYLTGNNGGTINISANNLYSYGNLNFYGGSNTGGNGGRAGILYINTTNSIDVAGKIRGYGGDGAIDCVFTNSLRGKPGTGGSIIMSSKNITLAGIINISRSEAGACNVNGGGSMNVSALDTLIINNSLVAKGNATIINLLGDKIIINSIVNATKSSTNALNGEVSIFFTSEFNASISSISPNTFLTRNSTFGKLTFISGFAGNLNNTINYTGIINIVENNISIDSATYPYLNVSANLTFYNANSSSGYMLRNNRICNSTTSPACNNFTALNATNVIFNVTSFTFYSLGDYMNPNATLNTPGNNTYSRTASVNLTANLTDDASGIKNATIWVYNESGLYNKTSITGYVIEITSITASVVIEFIDGIYKWFWSVFDFTGHSFASPENYTLTVDLTFASLDFVNPTPANRTGVSASSFIWNISITDIYLANLTYDWNGAKTWYNVSNLTHSGNGNYNLSINQSGLVANTLYVYNVSVLDKAGNFNSTGRREVMYDTISPIVVNGSGMPLNNVIGGSEILFNWSVTDNFDANIDCYPTIDSVLNTTYSRNTANGTKSNATFSLSGGNHIINITCIDDVGNRGQTTGISYLVAVINISSPVKNQVIRQKESFGFVVEEKEGTEFLNKVNISISNSSMELANLLSVGDPTHVYVYEFPQWDPSYLTVYATGFNGSVGSSSNTTDSRRIVFLREAGTTISPNLQNACPNMTYIINGTHVSFYSISDLDTLFKSENLTITSPSGLVHRILSYSNISDVNNYTNTFNYTFFVNETGTYNISAIITDYEDQESTWSYFLISNHLIKNMRINSSTVNFTWMSSCSNINYMTSNDITLRIPENGLVDLNVTREDVLKNIYLHIRDVNLTSNLSEAVTYLTLNSEVSAPTNERRIFLFELNSSFNFTNYTLTLDYTPVISTITNESTIKLYQCSELASCTLVNTSAVVDTSANVVRTTLISFSVFMLTESSASTPTPEENDDGSGSTSSSGGGGGGGTTVIYKNFNIITPGAVDLGLKDELIVPITLNNSEKISLYGIKLNATSNTKDITPIFESKEVVSLNPGHYKTINLKLQSHSTPGTYEVTITADVSSPKIIESSKLFVRLVEGLQVKEVMEKIAISQDLFRENPECLELNDLLIEAQKRVDAGEYDVANQLVQKAINDCRSMITSQEEPYLFVRIREWKTPVIVSLIAIILVLFVVMFILNRRSYITLKNSILTSKSSGAGIYEKKSTKREEESSKPKPRVTLDRASKNIWMEE